MSKIEEKDLVVSMFLNESKSPYGIHMDTGIALKTVYHYVKQSEEAQHRRKRQLKENKEISVMA